MANPTLDTSLKQSNSGNGSWTFSFTCSGTSRALTLKLSAERNSATSPSYGGIAFSLLDRVTISTGILELWGLVNPPTGANTVSIDQSGAGPQSGTAIVESWNGVHQTTPFGTTAKDTQDNQTGNTTGENVTASNDDLVTDACVTYNNTMTANSGQTVTQNDNGASGDKTIAASYKTGSASVAMGWTIGGNQFRGSVAVALKAAIVSFYHSQNPKGLFFALV